MWKPVFLCWVLWRRSSNAAIVKVIYAKSVQVQQSVRGWIDSKYVAMIATVSLKWIPPRRNVESVSTRAARNVVGLSISKWLCWVWRLPRPSFLFAWRGKCKVAQRNGGDESQTCINEGRMRKMITFSELTEGRLSNISKKCRSIEMYRRWEWLICFVQ